jgi:four helix bundle protein
MSFAANYRAACRASSRKKFVAKLGVSIEKLDESLFLVECATEAKLGVEIRVGSIKREPGEILAILSASRSTARKNLYPKTIHPVTNR